MKSKESRKKIKLSEAWDRWVKCRLKLAALLHQIDFEGVDEIDVKSLDLTPNELEELNYDDFIEWYPDPVGPFDWATLCRVLQLRTIVLAERISDAGYAYGCKYLLEAQNAMQSSFIPACNRAAEERLDRCTTELFNFMEVITARPQNTKNVGRPKSLVKTRNAARSQKMKADGKSNEEIAESLGVKGSTVRGYLRMPDTEVDARVSEANGV